MNKPTPTEVNAALGALKALADAIRELGEVPSGHLYANLQGHITIGQFEQAIGILKNAGLVRESNAHLLTWIGPALPEGPSYVCAVDRGGCGRTFRNEDGFRDHDCTDMSSPAMSMLEIVPSAKQRDLK